MKIKTNIKLIMIILAIAVAVFVASKIYQANKPIHTVYVGNLPLYLRADARKADKVPISPSLGEVNSLFWDEDLKNVTILFKPGSNSTNGIYRVEVFELTYKLTVIYRPLYQYIGNRTITAAEVQDYDNISSEPGVLKIVLVSPESSQRAEVRAVDGNVFIYGRSLKDFDLAVGKTVLAALNMTVQ